MHDTTNVAARLNLVDIQVHIPATRVPQPDGSVLLKPGKPVIVEQEISVREAAKILGMSTRWVVNECLLGRFKTAYQPGARPGTGWRIQRSEVLSRRQGAPG